MNTNETIIVLDEVTKQFKDYKALDNISLNFEKGKIYGIIGRNGSGKTVLFKCICGFMPVTSGKILVDGLQIGKDIDIPKNIGIIIENPGFIPNCSGYKNLMLLANMTRKVTKTELYDLMTKVGLDARSKKIVGNYSLGMKQRLGIAQAIMDNPEILILDEPMNGLDNEGVNEIRHLLLQMKEEGKTILLASHNREDIHILCDEVYEMDKGIISYLSTEVLT